MKTSPEINPKPKTQEKLHASWEAEAYPSSTSGMLSPGDMDYGSETHDYKSIFKNMDSESGVTKFL